MSRIFAAVLIVLGIVGIKNSLEMSLSNSMKAYALQNADAAAQSSVLFFASFGVLFLGAILLEIDRRKKKK